MRFMVGERVKVEGNKDEGYIKSIKQEILHDSNGRREILRYLVKMKNESMKWCEEDHLSYPDQIDINNEDKIDKLIIDAALDSRQFGVIRGILNEQRIKRSTASDDEDLLR